MISTARQDYLRNKIVQNAEVKSYKKSSGKGFRRELRVKNLTFIERQDAMVLFGGGVNYNVYINSHEEFVCEIERLLKSISESARHTQ